MAKGTLRVAPLRLLNLFITQGSTLQPVLLNSSGMCVDELVSQKPLAPRRVVLSWPNSYQILQQRMATDPPPRLFLTRCWKWCAQPLYSKAIKLHSCHSAHDPKRVRLVAPVGIPATHCTWVQMRPIQTVCSWLLYWK